MSEILDWPSWFWVLFITQIATGFAVQRLERGLSHIGRQVLEIRHPELVD